MVNEKGKVILKIEYGYNECKIYFTDDTKLIITAISGVFDNSDTSPELGYEHIKEEDM